MTTTPTITYIIRELSSSDNPAELSPEIKRFTTGGKVSAWNRAVAYRNNLYKTDKIETYISVRKTC